MAGSTGLEPAASGVTGRRYNRLNYDPLNKQPSKRIPKTKLQLLRYVVTHLYRRIVNVDDVCK
jgi:hypothetical protein